MTRTHLKNAFGLQSADFCQAAFSGLSVLSVRIAPAAAAWRRNPLDLAVKAIFEMGSNFQIPISNKCPMPQCKKVLVIGDWNFIDYWSLGIGIYDNLRY